MTPQGALTGGGHVAGNANHACAQGLPTSSCDLPRHRGSHARLNPPPHATGRTRGRTAASASAGQQAAGSRQWAGDGCAPPHPREDRAHKIYRLTLACPQVPEGLLEQPVQAGVFRMQDAHSAVVFGQPRPCCCQCCPSPCRAPNEREAVVCRCVDEDELAHHDVLAHVHALVTGAARAVWGEEGYGASAPWVPPAGSGGGGEDLSHYRARNSSGLSGRWSSMSCTTSRR